MQANLNTILLMQENNIRLRRIRLLSDVFEDYQDNMRRAFRLMEQDIDADTGMQRGDDDDVMEREPQIHRNAQSNRNAQIHRNAQVHRNATDGPYEYTSGFNNEEIFNATSRLVYNSSMNQTQCPITWEPFLPGQQVLRINGCEHIFSCDAIVEWFRRRRHCPVCRARPVLFPYAQNTSPRPAQSNLSEIPFNITTISAEIQGFTESGERSQSEIYQATRRRGDSHENDADEENNETPAAATNVRTSLVNAVIAELLATVNDAILTNTSTEHSISFNLHDLLNPPQPDTTSRTNP